jgi:hypothetical protein
MCWKMGLTWIFLDASGLPGSRETMQGAQMLPTGGLGDCAFKRESKAGREHNVEGED